MSKQFLRIACMSLLGMAAFAGPSIGYSDDQKAIYGWIENVRIQPGDITLKAKLDTGATTSSLHAEDIEKFERDGEDWVRFFTRDPNADERVKVEREVSRRVKIVRHNGPSQRRVVVKIGVCVGNIYRESEASLIDRSNFTYPILIGRNFLEERILVDSAETFTTDPACDMDAAR